MNSTWIFQLTISIGIILSVSLLVKKYFEITLSKSFLVSVSLITSIMMFLNIFYLNRFSIYVLIILSFFPFFFSKVKKILLEEKFLIIEFIIVLIVIFYLSHNRIFMDEDELYFWGIKYKYLINEFNNSFNSLVEPYKSSSYGNATAIFQTFITFLVGYNEGGAIFANNIIIICTFYFLFGDKLKKPTQRFLYFLIFYLILNNLSFGLLSIYNDTIVATIYAALIYYIINSFNYKNIKNISLLIIIIIFFINIHRISSIFFFLLIILPILKYFSVNIFLKNKLRSFLILGIFVVITGIYYNYFLGYNLGLFRNFQLGSIKIDFLIKTIFLTKSYNAQFGTSYNEILDFLKIDFIKLPEYILHNFIWYIACITIALINGRKTKNVNIFFLIIFLIFSFMIIFNKIYIHNLSYQVFGRYISFILIPFFLINLIYLNNFKKKDQLTLFLFIFFLILSTPKKTFGYFFTKEFYSKYDEWNKNYYEVRKEHKKLFSKIQSIYGNEKYNALVIFNKNAVVYDKHPSIYHAALKLDLYPNEISIVNMDEILNKEVHPDQLKGKNILIYYNFEMKEKKKVQKKFEEYRENHNFKMEAFDFLINN